MNDQTINNFGKRLKAAREAMNQSTKDVAAQLRLNERVILMMESGDYDEELPVTFLKGYLRSYAKLLQVPEEEVKEATLPLQPKPTHLDPALLPPSEDDITSRNYRMQFASAVIGLTVIGLIGTWWHNHKTTRAEPEMTPINLKLNEPMANSAAPTESQAMQAAPGSLPAPAIDPNQHPMINAITQQLTPPDASKSGATAPVSTEAPTTQRAQPQHASAAAKTSSDNTDDPNDDDDNVDDDN